jgi:primosomal protein N' (replication factor Y)
MNVDVAIPKTKIDFLTYHTSDDVHVGDLVCVPLRNTLKHGVVINTNSQRDVYGMKDIEKVVLQHFLPPRLLGLYKWIAEYYLSSLGEVLRLALPSKILKKYEVTMNPRESIHMVKTPSPTYPQSQAIKKILDALKKECFETFLLYGITGSGKTEVYLRCVDEVIKSGGHVLVLVPEISMTPLIYQRFQERFKNDVVTIHSSLSEKQRRNIWYAIKQGKYRVVIGPRSTIFIPIPDLKLIIIDEEHDQSYKEHERMPRYHARDVAVMRGKFENCAVVLGSATPQLESYHNAGIGKYHLLTLQERIDAKPLPTIEIIDLKRERKKFISPKLETKVLEALKNNEQVILFLNRRGFAPSLLCPHCGFTAKCPYCRLPLVYHKKEKKEAAFLTCHICGYKSKVLSICPKCSRGTLLYRGAGTQRIEELMNYIIRQSTQTASVVRLDRDSIRKKGQAEKILKIFEQGDAQIMLGTQLVTKGFDFPEVTLVGIVNADVVLHIPDFRSSERTFQLLTQVAGRSGRGNKPGTVLMQTFHPELYSALFSQLQDFPHFYAEEMKLRRDLKFPPFSKLILIRFRGENENIVWSEAKKIFDILARIKNIQIFGPNRSFYYRIRKNYRVFILLKTTTKFQRRKLKFLTSYKLKNCNLEIDVDPLEVF